MTQCNATGNKQSNKTLTKWKRSIESQRRKNNNNKWRKCGLCVWKHCSRRNQLARVHDRERERERDQTMNEMDGWHCNDTATKTFLLLFSSPSPTFSSMFCWFFSFFLSLRSSFFVVVRYLLQFVDGRWDNWTKP